MTDQERRQLYRKVFSTKDGIALLEDLRVVFNGDGPSFVMTPHKDQAIHYCPLHAAVIDGQKQVYQHCRNFSRPENKTKKPTVTK